MDFLDSKKIVLASASPRRLELLRQIGIEPEVIPSRIKERIALCAPSEAVERLSAQKAGNVAASCAPGTIVIGSDTVVVLDGKILGKPKSHEEAREMITMLAGRSHEVYTGVTVVDCGADGRRSVTFSDRTAVAVYPMTDAEIRKYADSEEPMDKAGAYAVQGEFAKYIRGLSGSYANVVGLPVGRLYQEMKLFFCGEQNDKTDCV